MWHSVRCWQRVAEASSSTAYALPPWVKPTRTNVRACVRMYMYLRVRVCAMRASCINPVGMIYGLGGSFQLFAGQVRPVHVARTYSFGWPLLCDCKLACQLLGAASYISLYRLSGKKYKFRILNKYTAPYINSRLVFALFCISSASDSIGYQWFIQLRGFGPDPRSVSRVRCNRTWKCFIEYKVPRVIVNIKPMTIRDIREELRNDDKYPIFEISCYFECYTYCLFVLNYHLMM